MKETTYLLKINGKPICTGKRETLQALAVQIPAEITWSIEPVSITPNLFTIQKWSVSNGRSY